MQAQNLTPERQPTGETDAVKMEKGSVCGSRPWLFGQVLRCITEINVANLLDCLITISQ